MTFKNRYKAEDAVCEAFVTLGTLAGIDVDSGKGPGDLDEDLIAACYQSNFGDPHFLGGPCIFNYADSLAKVERIFVPAFDVSNRLVEYIAKSGDDVKTYTAKQAAAVISSAYGWLKVAVST